MWRFPADGPLPWNEFPQTDLIDAVGKAIGARAPASPDLLGHFVRAGGGNVNKASSLYLAVADEFIELRDMARYVRLHLQGIFKGAIRSNLMIWQGVER